MQMSTHLLEPAPIMSKKIETKAVFYTVGTRTHACVSPRDTVTDKREKTACEKDVFKYMCVLLTVTFTLLKQ